MEVHQRSRFSIWWEWYGIDREIEDLKGFLICVAIILLLIFAQGSLFLR